MAIFCGLALIAAALVALAVAIALPQIRIDQAKEAREEVQAAYKKEARDLENMKKMNEEFRELLGD